MLIINDKEYKDEEEFNKALDNENTKLNKVLENVAKKELDSSKAFIRIRQLQDKAILEGLTDEEKKEYKELRGL